MSLDAYEIDDALPEPLPDDPFPLLSAWIDEARDRRIQPNPGSMTLSTVDPDGRPSARVVLCKGLDAAAGRVTFYTNYSSRKGVAIAHEPRVALTMHWDALNRQVRIEGRATTATDAQSDAYFRTRSVESRLGAWASRQSEPLESREALIARVAETMARFDVNLDNLEDAEIPRPPFWGGYHVWAERVELWVGGPGRIHDRARWTRTLTPAGDGFTAGGWSATRLYP